MKITILNLLVGTYLVLVIAIPAQAQAQTPEQSSQANRIKALRLSSQPDGLHKAAIANGGTIELGPHVAPINRISDLPDLTSSSNLIVSAKVLSSASGLTDNGRDIETVYTLQIARTFKGTSEKTISLAVPGGSYTFADGSKVSQTEDLCSPLVPNVEYILFLLRGTNQPNMYYSTSVCQAVFEVARDGHHVTSHSYLGDDHLREEAKVGKLSFNKRLQNIVEAQK